MAFRVLCITLLLTYFNLACHPERELIFTEEQMIEILIDVHVAEAALQGLGKDQKDSLSALYYNQIFEIHSIKEEDFLNQMDYMKHHPKYMEVIYEKVLAEITRREAELK